MCVAGGRYGRHGPVFGHRRIRVRSQPGSAIIESLRSMCCSVLQKQQKRGAVCRSSV
jgi:hypothetical protein